MGENKIQYRTTKPIRVIELFSGIKAQTKALENLGAEFEHYKTCEWEVNAVNSAKAIHNPNDNTDYSEKLTKNELIAFLYKKGISSDGKKPMELKSIQRKNESWLRLAYNSIISTNNLVNIMAVKGEDLGIVETNKYEYILTYSFPCTDISLAGKQAGMSKGSGTRSGMLWEVERLLKECKELPQVLLMENVPQVHSKKNISDFNDWISFLKSLGYSNHWEDLNAKHYRIPQNRNRTFMVSILGDYDYVFPAKQELELRLKDVLEGKVDEKYYLSDDMIKYITSNNEKWTGNNNKSLVNKSIASTINTGEGSRRCDASNYILDDIRESDVDLKAIRKYGIFDKDDKKHQAGAVWDRDGLAPTLDTMQGGYRQPLIEENIVNLEQTIIMPEKTKKSYVEAHEGDGVYINRPHQKRGVVQKGMIQTIKSSCNDIGVVVRGNYSPSRHNASRVVDINGLAPTVMENHGTVTAIVEEKSLFTDLEKQMITEDGNIKRYINSDVVDKFEEGDCADISFPNGYNKGNRVYKGFSPTLNGTTVKNFIVKVDEKGNEIKVIVGDNEKEIDDFPSIIQKQGDRGTNNYSVSDISYTIPSNPMSDRGQLLVEKKSVNKDCEKVIVDDTYSNREPRIYTETSPTLRSERAGLKVVEYDELDNLLKSKNKRLKSLIEKTNFEEGEVLNLDLYNQTTNDKISQTITLPHHNSQACFDGLRIRKLTPKECFRLMSFNDEDFERAEKVNSNSQLYKQAGNSISVFCLMGIFGTLLNIDYNAKIDKIVEKYTKEKQNVK